MLSISSSISFDSTFRRRTAGLGDDKLNNRNSITDDEIEALYGVSAWDVGDSSNTNSDSETQL